MPKFKLCEAARDTRGIFTDAGEADDIGEILECACRTSGCAYFQVLSEGDHVADLVRFGDDGQCFWLVS